MKKTTITLGLALLTALSSPAWSQDRRDRDSPRADQEQRERDQAPWRIGVMVDSLDPLLRQHLQIPEDTGVVADRVMEGGPAARAGLNQGDIILGVGKDPVSKLDDLREGVEASAESGKPLILWVLQEGKKKQLRIAPPAREEPDDRRRGRDREPANPSDAQENENRGLARLARALRELEEELEDQAETIEDLERRIEEAGGECQCD